MIQLRDSLAEERLSDDRAMIMEQMDRMAALASARTSYDPGQVDPSSPYFAHLKLSLDDGPQRDILLGKNTFVKDGVRIVDWRNAPISQVFYRYHEGEPFDEEFAGRTMSGEILARRTVTIVNGQLVRVSSPRQSYLLTGKGWQNTEGQEALLQGGAGSALRPDTAVPVLGIPDGSLIHRHDKHLPEIAALLDTEQFDLLTKHGDALLVVTGGAGSGKTTVGLHRLAFLAFDKPKRYRPNRMLVLVFSRALSRYVSKVLPALGVKGVRVQTLGNWTRYMLRRHFPGITPNISTNPPTAVVRFKTHRLLVPMLREAVKSSTKKDPLILFDELFSDRNWLQKGVERYAPNAFSKDEIHQIHRWCTDLHFDRVDHDRAPDESPPCYDEEDGMILLYLYQLMRGKLRFNDKWALSYDHLLIDEVQDFSPLELLVLLDSVRNNSATLAGDPAQKITDNDFSNWSEVLKILGQDHVELSPLRISYRSTKQIMELAIAVLGDLAPEEPLQTTRSGAPVDLLRFGGSGESMTYLADALVDLFRREPNASVAVLTPNPKQADDTYAALRRSDLDNLSRVRNGEFSFEPGIEICEVAQTKGLEFDYVVLLDVDQDNYPNTPSARHLLHVGITRAIHQLWLFYCTLPSPILPPELKAKIAG
jgi:DNA helicase-2/ATP-dependent DNA helicase PcrA